MTRNHKIIRRIAGVMLFVTMFAISGFAQATRQEPESSAGAWPYVVILIALASLGVVYYFWKQSKQTIEGSAPKDAGRHADHFDSDDFENSDVDADKELEWLRKANSPATNRPAISFGLKKNGARSQRAGKKSNVAAESPADTKAFQERMKMLQYSQLPINSFGDLMPPKHFEPLQESSAKALLDAIDQTNPDIEENESVRDVAIKVLAAFRTWNAVEALTQIALYDLSASLRSKAVTVLADFDHESVFETILLACADPTREVRAAAARGLFRLNFDRSQAWRRIIETRDEFRMSQAVRASVEAGIAAKSFERLVHEDLKIAYEAFTLVALMVKAGETKEIFETIRTHKDERVKFALLHVLKAIKDERSLPGLNELLQCGLSSTTLLEKVKDAAKSVSVSAKSTV